MRATVDGKGSDALERGWCIKHLIPDGDAVTRQPGTRRAGRATVVEDGGVTCDSSHAPVLKITRVNSDNSEAEQ